MSSSRSPGGQIREGTRVVLREITATLHNSPPMQSPHRKSGNDSTVPKSTEHEVKVRFAREFADVGSITYSAPESLSSASSFHSLSSSLSTKSSSGICPDSIPESPNDTSNISYVDANIPGVDDLILACADIQLDGEEDEVLNNSQDLSQDQTFTSAIDERDAEDLTRDSLSEFLPEEDLRNVTQVIEDHSSELDSTQSTLNRTQDINDRSILGTICVKEPLSVVPYLPKNSSIVLNTGELKETSVSPNKGTDVTSDIQTCCTAANSFEEGSLPRHSSEGINLNSTVSLSPNKSTPTNVQPDEKIGVENNSTIETSSLPSVVLWPTVNSIPSEYEGIENVLEPSLPSISTTTSLNGESEAQLNETSVLDITKSVTSVLPRSSSPVNHDSTGTTFVPVDVVKSPGFVEEDSRSDSQLVVISPELCNDTNSEENCTRLLSDIPTDTPEIPKDSEIDIHTKLHITCSNISTKTDNSPQKEVCLAINTPTLCREENIPVLESNTLHESPGVERLENYVQQETVNIVKEEEERTKEEEEQEKEKEAEGKEREEEGDRNNAESSDEKLDTTLTLQDTSLNFDAVPGPEQYAEFKPQRQSTTLALVNEQQNFEELKSAADKVANDIFKSSFEFTDDSNRFVSATSDLFEDPRSFDFLLTRTNSKAINRLRAESLYVKFDPLVSDISMLPQGNTQPINGEQNGENDSPLPNIGTPKRNPAIAAIDRLLFYSPIPTSTMQKTDQPQEKIEQATEETKTPDTAIIVDINMNKELELVRTTVLQLEEELEKQKKLYEAELERQKNAFQEKINKLQTQMAQELKSNSEMTVVVEEYEKSISSLLTERERDRTNFEQEKAKLQEELQTTNVHLTNTEAAFNDVHHKYERLKGVVAVYKSNETVLKESIQENLDTIKGLETRYDQMKNHAMTQLEKANFDLEQIRKQHEDETVKLRALVRKAELKSNSLTELVEQKTKENKELTQILDEVIARVGHQNAE